MKWIGIRFVLPASIMLALVVFPGILAAQESGQASPAAPAALIPYDTPLARYGDLELSLSYFFQYARDKLYQFERSTGDERKQILDQALQQTIFEHLIARLSKEQGYWTETEFIAHNRVMENDWLVRFYQYHQYYQKMVPTDDELKRRYEETKKEYFQPSQFSFRHIFFQTIDKPEAVQKQAPVRAQEALALIRSGSDFVEIAQKYSDSSRKGDLIGPIKTREYNPDKAINPVIEDALRSMKPGDISDVVPTKYGYEILKLETFENERYTPFEAAKLSIQNQLMSERLQGWIQALLDEHFNQAVTRFQPYVVFDENAAPDAVVAVVYGQPITRYDYNITRTTKQNRDPNEGIEAYRDRIIEYLKSGLIYQYIVAKLARDLGYDQIPAFRMLTDIGRNQKLYRVWWTRMAEQYLQAHPITEEEKLAYYESNANRFQDRQTSHAGVIRVDYPPHDKQIMYEIYKAQQAALGKAKEAIERIKKGEDFAQLAKELSTDPSAADGGDLGYIAAETDKLPRMAAAEALRLEAGAVSEEPFNGEDCYYVFKCFDKPERGKLEYSDPTVQKRIEQGLLSQKRSQYMEELMGKMVDKSRIELLYPDFYTLDPGKAARPSIDPPSQ
ncbi:MAG: peptidylprolyl isomerase [bacterium]